MSVPLLVVAGVDDAAVELTTTIAAYDLPHACVVTYRIDVDADVVTCDVSDMTGVVEQRTLRVEHLCTGCVMRQHMLPTLLRLARDGRWASIVLRLPQAFEPAHLVWAIGHSRLDGVALADHVAVASTLAALDGDDVVEDLLGDTLLTEMGVATSAEEDRGLGEALGRTVEFADQVVVVGEPSADALDLLAAVTRPGTDVVVGTEHLDGPALVAARHDAGAAAAWMDHVDEPMPDDGAHGDAWTPRLESWRPFHPGRLLERIERLGSGRIRTRGCTWVPSRPGLVVLWDGAGGQLSIGHGGPWGGTDAVTRIVVTGHASQDLRARIEDAFTEALLTDDEIRRGLVWGPLDGLEPWLGGIAADAA